MRAARKFAIVLAALALTGAAPPESQPLYLLLATTPAGSYDTTLGTVRQSLAEHDLKLLADYETGGDRTKCSFRARVLIAESGAYTRRVLVGDGRGAFAAQLRLAVFEDEAGVHVSMVNPRSLNRTIVAETGRDAEWNDVARQLAGALTARFPGQGTSGYGPVRDKGRIGKTMGVMAGGPFEQKIKVVATAPLGTNTVAALAQRVYASLEKQSAEGEWKLRPAFLQLSAEGDVAIVGLTGAPMEARSFAIVGAGGQGARSKYACPGLDHAAAYPLELVIARKGDVAEFRVVDEMFRMKIYFEDAGMMAFAKNMGMPGSIGAELRRKLGTALTPQ